MLTNIVFLWGDWFFLSRGAVCGSGGQRAYGVQKGGEDGVVVVFAPDEGAVHVESGLKGAGEDALEEGGQKGDAFAGGDECRHHGGVAGSVGDGGGFAEEGAGDAVAVVVFAHGIDDEAFVFECVGGDGVARGEGVVFGQGDFQRPACERKRCHVFRQGQGEGGEDAGLDVAFLQPVDLAGGVHFVQADGDAGAGGLEAFEQAGEDA